MRIAKIGEGVDVMPLLWALQSHPELWNQNTLRTQSEESPHHGLSDIWARYAAPGEDSQSAHKACWYPCAEHLPVQTYVDALMREVGGAELGGVLITKIPAGINCKPHIDKGWHARYYEKFAIQVQSAPGQLFCFEGEALETRPGDVFWFDNAYTHWVTNPTPYERITLIACIKRGT